MSYEASTVARLNKPAPRPVVLPLKLLHAGIKLPMLAFLLTLTAMLFRPPDLKSFPFDRVAFFALICVLGIRFCIQRKRLRTYPATWPLFVLLLLGIWGALTQPYDSQAWSLLASKWVTPFVFFHAAGLVFNGEESFRKLEIFFLAVLIYLSTTAALFVLGADSLIVPRFITDEGIGIHADRARGPFLQAVANGLCLNLLGLVELDSFRRRKLPSSIGIFLFVTVPLALLATKTRAVWLSAALSVSFLVFFGSTRRLRRAALALSITGAIGLCIVLVHRVNTNSFAERMWEQSPVDFRAEMYEAGLQMFSERPLFGWGNEWRIQPEIEKRVHSFHPEYYVFHNTFLELAVQRGLFGLGLYFWLIVCLFRLRKAPGVTARDGLPFSDAHFRKLWPLLLATYLLNACAVVMNYQFVNAVLFTIAGILAAQQNNARLQQSLLVTV